MLVQLITHQWHNIFNSLREEIISYSIEWTMNKGGPIILIEDDPDDQEALSEIFRRLNYKK